MVSFKRSIEINLCLRPYMGEWKELERVGELLQCVEKQNHLDDKIVCFLTGTEYVVEWM